MTAYFKTIWQFSLGSDNICWLHFNYKDILTDGRTENNPESIGKIDLGSTSSSF